MSGQVRITGVMDGPLSGGTPKFVELLVNSSTGFTGWALRNHNNGNIGVSNSTDLSGLGTVNAGEYIYVIKNGDEAEFQTWFSLTVAEFNALNTISGASPNINGDDAISLNNGTSNVDVFGEIGVDGTGTAWEYMDGWAYGGNSVTGTFNSSDWTYSSPNALDGETSNAASATPFPSLNSALPLELIAFTAIVKSTTTLLQWQTATEINNDYMAIERSNDGRTFNEIGRVQGAGTSYEANNYSFVDEKPNTGMNYYRLRQVDYDGRAEIHRTVSVFFGDANDTVQVFPTEAANEINVIFAKTITDKTQLIVVDVTGKECLRTELGLGQSEYTIDVSNLTAGQFFLRIQSETGIQVARFMKL